MTDTPPPTGRPNEPGDGTSRDEQPTEHLPAPSDTGAPDSGPPEPGPTTPHDWTGDAAFAAPAPPARRRFGRLRSTRRRLFGSRVGVLITAIVVGAVLVVGGLGIAEATSDGHGERDGRGTHSTTDERHGRGGGERGDAFRQDGTTGDGSRNDGADDNDNSDDNADNSTGNGTGSGTGQQGTADGNAASQSVLGTLTSVNSATVTIKTSAGSSTYSLSTGVSVIRGGATSAITALKPGDAVQLFVTTSGTSTPVVATIVAG